MNFSLSVEENEKLEKWIKNHDFECRFSNKFSCACGAGVDVTEYSQW